MKREHLWAHHELDATAVWKLAEGGYANRLSVRQGESISLHISNSRSYYDIFIFREGAKRELISTINDVRGALQAVPKKGYETGFGWSATAGSTDIGNTLALDETTLLEGALVADEPVARVGSFILVASLRSLAAANEAGRP